MATFAHIFAGNESREFVLVQPFAVSVVLPERFHVFLEVFLCYVAADVRSREVGDEPHELVQGDGAALPLQAIVDVNAVILASDGAFEVFQ